MKKTCLPLAIFALIGSVAVPTAVSANDFVNNWMDTLYVSTFVGGHFLHDIETDTLDAGTLYSDETYEQETGFAARFAIGGRLNEHFRAEVELGFNRTNQGSIEETLIGATTTSTYNGKGHIDTYTLMTNVWADLPVFDNSWGLTPYIGGGIGAALVNSQLVYTNFSTFGPQDSSVEVVAQLGTGINWAVNDRFSAGVGYRLMFISGPETSQPTTGQIATYRFDDLLSHSVGITLTMNLN